MMTTKVFIVNGDKFVDSDFVNFCQSKLENSSLKHYGFGDFYLDVSGKGLINFIRSGEKLEGMSGRSHKMYDNANGVLVDSLIEAMQSEIIEVPNSYTKMEDM